MKKEELHSVVELFWQTIPPVWHATRSITHQTATEEFKITVSQFHTLRRIFEGEMSVSDLADCMNLSRSNISRSVDDLVNAGYVIRRQDVKDRRNVNLFLTDSGRKLVHSLLESVGKKMANKFSIIEASELEDVVNGLKALQKIFRKTIHKAKK